ncbi:MAG: PLP-dependent aminotransferase family protein [Actinomycetia bacterium]|nr:PLP-dependent aminotransferase family protein [Actinomycetes bacterium]MCP4961022.1 PLP-dependent aminotransferase family protein [Actinomycetes bacterium]
MDEHEIAESLGSWGTEDGPIYLTLADALDELIRAGRLAEGERLPAERRLSAALHVSRGTVVAAYDELRGRSRIVTRQGSGTTVAEHARPVQRLDPVPPRGAIYDGMLDGGFDDLIDMRSAYWVGVDDLPPEAFELPTKAWREVLAGAGYHPCGYPPLRGLIAKHLTDSGIVTSPDEVLVTNGSQQALALAAQLYLGRDDLCVVEELTYPAFIDLIAALRGRLHTTPVDSEGVDVDLLDRAVRRVRPPMVYLMAGVHNPTGAVLCEERRQRLVEYIENWDAVVLDDRTLAEMVIDRPRPLPIARPDGSALDNVISVGSTSKSTWGGLRIGWVRAEAGMVDRLSRLKAVMDLGSPIASQVMVSEMLARSEAPTLRRAELERRRDVLARGLINRLPEWRFDVPPAGLCLWVELPVSDVSQFISIAARHGVGLVSGAASSPDGGYRNYLRLPFGNRVEVLEDVVERLAVAWADHQKRPIRSALYGVIG